MNLVLTRPITMTKVVGNTRLVPMTCGLQRQRIQNESRRLGNNSSSEISDEYDVMKHALGERRGHIRGVGRVVKSVPAEMSSSYNTQSQGWQQNWKQQMREQV
ncbi:hypothetical protein E3N88_31912 [Mikania micrantha]|uniref:Uncharacterized protein n=1 Tax=Mikania micrantha TaxID=192012 RepID=A0A5N6M7P3_9ASTR|nr:hypothetical protein E3N88_31912 [Mikania micrantha]